MSNKIKVKLQKLKAVFEHPNTPIHEAATAKRIYDRVKAEHNIEDWGVAEFEVSGSERDVLAKYGVNVIEFEDGDIEYRIEDDNQIGVDMALHDIFTRAINKRRKRSLENEELKQLGE